MPAAASTRRRWLTAPAALSPAPPPSRACVARSSCPPIVRRSCELARTYERTMRPRGSGLRHLGKGSDLAQQGDGVDQLPLLLDLAVTAATDREAHVLDLPSGGRRARQLTLVPAADGGSRGHVVAVGELVVDRDAEIRESVSVAPDHFREAVGTANLFKIGRAH